MINSEWHPGATWSKPLPSTPEEIRAFVARLRTHVIRDWHAQNDVDEACHLIEALCNMQSRDER